MLVDACDHTPFSINPSHLYRVHCVMLPLAQPTLWRAVAGWVKDQGSHCALKFATADQITHLLVESAAFSLAGADVPGVVRLRGMLDCSAAMPASEHPNTHSFLMQFLQCLSEQLAHGAGCIVLDRYDGSLARALNRRAPACGTCPCGRSLASTQQPAQHCTRLLRCAGMCRPAPLRSWRTGATCLSRCETSTAVCTCTTETSSRTTCSWRARVWTRVWWSLTLGLRPPPTRATSLFTGASAHHNTQPLACQQACAQHASRKTGTLVHPLLICYGCSQCIPSYLELLSADSAGKVHTLSLYSLYTLVCWVIQLYMLFRCGPGIRRAGAWLARWGSWTLTRAARSLTPLASESPACASLVLAEMWVRNLKWLHSMVQPICVHLRITSVQANALSVL